MKDSNQVKSSGELLSLLNHKLPIADAIFHLFPRLPTELRLMIWEQSLTCERYIKVELCIIDEKTGKMRRGGVIPGKVRRLTGPYRIIFHHPPKPSALYSTSIESRASAKRFYRIVLPCFYFMESPTIKDLLHLGEQNSERNQQGIVLGHAPPDGPSYSPFINLTKSEALIPGTLCFNPELDTLEIKGWPLLANFAHDAWSHDPRRAGLHHVAFSCTSFSFTLRFRHLPRYASSEEQLRQVMARLRSVTFIHYTAVDRVSLVNTEAHTNPAKRQCLLRYGCSLPVAGATGNFSRQKDPRLIGSEVLKSVYFDLRRMSSLTNPYRRWTELVEKLRVTTPFVYKIAYATDEIKSRITCESDAVAFLKHESERWSKQLDKWEDSHQEQGRRHPKETAGHFNGAVETAVGFWTFPIDSCGQFRLSHYRSGNEPGGFCDFSAVQPELCLFDL
ncbi:hypothetical protein FANTH_2256 [Fusarium anthophilum]|uniref:2EXR domain-containing protein n=1 Tax=Fusarium anthophilum TaxID=48485 RepID=A0A8H4ZVF4_9HYPO|nr:hypothetical protein FANTH_2256 [Fusarium anthophilum]